jgi:hypothetical protein
VLGCNYRNATVTLAASASGQKAFVYLVTFYTLSPSNASALPSALMAALPSLNISAPGTIAFWLAQPSGGALAAVQGVVSGWGSLSPPARPPPSQPSTALIGWACTCTNGYSGLACTIPPLRPPHPPPIASWNKVDNAEVIAIDIPYGIYASNQAFYREAFIVAMASVSGLALSSVYPTNFQRSSVGSTLIYFDIIMMGSDYDIMSTSAAVQGLFDVSSPACSGTMPVGCPARPPLIAAFAAAGLPAPAAFYNDQYATSTLWTGIINPINTSQVGTWQYMDANEVIVLDIQYTVYATQQQYYKEAFMAALAQVLNITADTVFVTNFKESSVRTVKVYFDVELPATTSSESISTMSATIAGLFSICHGAAATVQEQRYGCPAGSGSALVLALQQYGLPATEAYYNDQV